MGNCLSGQKKSLNIVVAVFGLDNAGKTSTIKVLKGDPLEDVAPTIGFNSVNIKFKKREITLYDLGGGARIRDIWKNYYSEIFGFVYVVDASDHDRLEETRTNFASLLEDAKLQQKPVLFLLNKQDCPRALDEIEATERLNLVKVVNKYRSPCRVETCTSTKGVGWKGDPSIRSGFQWLIEQIESRYVQLSHRISQDVKEQRAVESRERKERIKRVEQARKERGESESMEGEEGEEGKTIPDSTKHSHRQLSFRPLPEILEEDASEVSGELSISTTVAQYNTRNGTAKLSNPADASRTTISSLAMSEIVDSTSSIPRLPPISPQPRRRLPPLTPPTSTSPTSTTHQHIVHLPPDTWESETAVRGGKSNSEDTTMQLSDTTHKRKRKKKRLRRFHRTEPTGQASDSEDNFSERKTTDTPGNLSNLPSSEPRPPTPPIRRVHWSEDN